MTDFNALYLYSIAIEEADRKCYNFIYERMIYLLGGISMNDPQRIYQRQPFSLYLYDTRIRHDNWLLFDYILKILGI